MYLFTKRASKLFAGVLTFSRFGLLLADELSLNYKLGPNQGGLLNYPNDLNLDHKEFSGYSVLGFGDFNSDKFTDLVLLKDDLKTLQVAIYDEKEKGFILPPEYKYLARSEVINVIPADWDYDGKLDLMILMSTEDAKVLDMEIICGTNKGLNTTPISKQKTSDIQPMVVDLNGDMKPDLLGYQYSQSSKKLVLTAWVNVAVSTRQPGDALFEIQVMDPSTLLPSNEGTEPTGDKVMCEWKSPHSNGFIDLNGDCLPDLFIVCKEESKYQIWVNKPLSTGSFSLDKIGELPAGAGPVTFSDMHGSGSLDMVFTTCQDSGCVIHTVANKQKPLCSPFATSAPGACRSQEDLCSADPKFYFETSDSIKISLSKLLEHEANLKNMPFVFGPVSHTYKSSFPVRVGDYNLDGYPDLLVSIGDKSSNPSKTAIAILESVPCSKDYCSESQILQSMRTYRLLKEGIQPLLNQTANYYDVHFFDFAEDGTLDLLMSTGAGKDRRLVAVSNGFHNDAFFLKTLVSNGACPRSCTGDSNPYGVNHVGATIKLTVVDTAGTTYARQAAQLPQTAYFGFQAPYSHIGLGRTNNYLQQLSVGVSRNRQRRHFNSWSGVIPNSQLVILPYQSPDSTDPTEWTRELFLNPGRAAKWVLIVLISCMATLAMVVSILAWLEKREDEKDRKRAIHHINFDAL